MVKAVVGEETQLKLIEDRLSQSRLPVQAHSLSLYPYIKINVCMSEIVESEFKVLYNYRWVS